MTGTSTPFGPDFYKSLVDMMMQASAEGTKIAVEMIWNALIYFLIHDWVLVLALITFFLAIAIFEFLLTGRWAMLGSVLYNYIYYGFLFLLGSIFGPDIFANDWIDLILFIVYAISFTLVGVILNKTGVRRR